MPRFWARATRAECALADGFALQTARITPYSAFALAEPKPDLLIVDYAMPERDGLELLRRCRAVVPPPIRALSISGTLTADIILAAEVKPDAFLAKPFTNGELLAAVQRLVG